MFVYKSIISSVKLLLLVMLASQIAYANDIRVNDGDSISVKISERELTRISISGEGRLVRLWGAANVLEVQPDKDQGEIFIRPLAHSPRNMSFFVRDSNGFTYTIVAEKSDIPSQNIQLRPVSPPRAAAVGSGIQKDSSDYEQQIKRLIRGMALSELPPGYSFNDEETPVPLWRETKITLVSTYSSFTLLGEVYQIINISDEELAFHESEFMDFGENVAAVAIENPNLQSGQSTSLFVVRNNDKGGR